MTGVSRREFLRQGMLLGGAALVGTGALSFQGCRASCDCYSTPSVRPTGRVLADLHVHPLMNAWNKVSPLGVRNPGLAKLIQTMLNRTAVTFKTSYEAGIDMLVVGHFNMFDEWLSMPTDPSPDAPRHTMRMIRLLNEELEAPEIRPYARLVCSSDELRAAMFVPKGDPEFRTTVIHALEGGHALGGDLDMVESFARQGIAMITVTHFFNKGIGSSANSFPFFPDDNSSWSNQGLSEFGRAVVRKMDHLGMIIDISHGTSSTVASVLKEVGCPVVASHSSARTLGDHPYGLTDEHIQEIGRRHGIVGIILMPYWLGNYSSEQQAETYGGLDDVVRSIIYVAKLVGVDRIGIGSDFAGFISGPRDMDCLAQVHKLRQLLLREFSEAETERILAQNVIDYFQLNWKYGSAECFSEIK